MHGQVAVVLRAGRVGDTVGRQKRGHQVGGVSAGSISQPKKHRHGFTRIDYAIGRAGTVLAKQDRAGGHNETAIVFHDREGGDAGIAEHGVADGIGDAEQDRSVAVNQAIIDDGHSESFDSIAISKDEGADGRQIIHTGAGRAIGGGVGDGNGAVGVIRAIDGDGGRAAIFSDGVLGAGEAETGNIIGDGDTGHAGLENLGVGRRDVEQADGKGGISFHQAIVDDRHQEALRGNPVAKAEQPAGGDIIDASPGRAIGGGITDGDDSGVGVRTQHGDEHVSAALNRVESGVGEGHSGIGIEDDDGGDTGSEQLGRWRRAGQVNIEANIASDPGVAQNGDAKTLDGFTVGKEEGATGRAVIGSRRGGDVGGRVVHGGDSVSAVLPEHS